MRRVDEFKENIKSRYIKQGLMFFTVGFALILSYLIITHFNVVQSGLGKINDILMPFYIGIVIAYIITPIFNLLTGIFYKWIKGKRKNHLKDLKFAKGLSTTVCLILIIGIAIGMFFMVVPGTIESIVTLIPKIEPALDDISVFVDNHLDESPELAAILQGRMDNFGETLLKLVEEKILPTTEGIFTGAYSVASGAVSTVINVILAIILVVYILNSKEIFGAQARKWVLSLSKPEKAEKWFELAELADQTFGGFINGKILDSAIIGVLCAILMTIFKMPMVALISVIIGVTNIIPFFGPFIGAIPSILLLMIIDPIKSLEFAVLVLALQQFDGNILGPKILGKATNLSSFWVIFAILVAGGLFGFIGMILGVPIFSLLYVYIGRGINNGLEDKEYNTDQKCYENYSKYGIDKAELYETYEFGSDAEGIFKIRNDSFDCDSNMSNDSEKEQ